MAARGHQARECSTVGGFIDGGRAQVKTASVFTRSVSAEQAHFLVSCRSLCSVERRM
jgi:hypothetical protein